jgi:hypothetical protein
MKFLEARMKISELYPDVISEDLEYEYKALLNADNPIKWAKPLQWLKVN